MATFVFFTLFPVSLLWANNFGWLTIAVIVRGLKEFGEPARNAFIVAQAGPDLRAGTYGAYGASYLTRNTASLLLEVLVEGFPTGSSLTPRCPCSVFTSPRRRAVK